MFFNAATVSILALFSVCNAAAPKQKRATSDVTIYAYGSGISGLEVSYGAGMCSIIWPLMSLGPNR